MRSIERAVAIVLAGTACGSPNTPATPAPESSASAAPAQTAEVEVKDAGPAFIATSEAVQPTPTTTTAPQSPRNPNAVCQEYKNNHRAPDGNGASTSPKNPDSPVVADALGYRAAGDVLCTIAWQRITTTVDETITPRCCPQARATGPCPKPYVQKVPGEKVLVENLRIADDGTATRQKLEWVMHNPNPTRQPYCGRRPEGFAIGDVEPATIAELLDNMATLEAASIDAFERLARELEYHGAPAELIARALAARDDEVRHTQTIDALARTHGGRGAQRPTNTSLDVRPLTEIALENAVEGCVHETWGALVATFQAERAATPELRSLFGAIAADERAHAALAHDIHRWLAASDTIVKRAAQELGARLAASDDSLDAGQRLLGMPNAHEARRLHEEYFG